jgi:hypothetical protein
MLADWALDRDARRHGLRIAELAGCPLEPENELVQCLRTVDAQTLLRAEGRANVYRLFFDTWFLINLV